MELNARQKQRIADDIRSALDAWSDVPEHVDFRYTAQQDGSIVISEYDDAFPGQAQRRYSFHPYRDIPLKIID